METLEKKVKKDRPTELDKGEDVKPARPGEAIAVKASEKPKAQARDGSLAAGIERELYKKGPNWEFNDYKKHLLERDPQKIAEITALPELHFLSGSEDQDSIEQDSIILNSYPRSGNTLLRGYLERIMGIPTGSDCDISKKLNLELMTLGLPGEGLVDKRVWISKSHYPERL